MDLNRIPRKRNIAVYGDSLANLAINQKILRADDVVIPTDAPGVYVRGDGTRRFNQIYPDRQTLTGAGAVDLLHAVTILITTGANALTLAAGTEGQRKFIKLKTDGGDGTLTPNSLQGGTTITFNDAGDFCELRYADGKWNIIVNSGCTVA